MPIPYILLTGLYCFLIFETSAVSDPFPMEVEPPFGDKVAHAILYGGLCGIVSIGMSRSDRGTTWPVLVVLPVVFSTAYGLTDEIHQLYVPERTFDLADLLADFTGASLVQAVLVFQWWRKQSGRRSGPGNEATLGPSRG